MNIGSLTTALVMLVVGGPQCDQLRPVANQFGAGQLACFASDDIGADLNRGRWIGTQIENPWVSALGTGLDVAHHEPIGITKEEHRSSAGPSPLRTRGGQQQNVAVQAAEPEHPSAGPAVYPPMSGIATE